MAEVFLNSIAEGIFNKLASLALEEIELAWGARKELEKLKSTLSTINSVLLDAEEQQRVNHEVRDWLRKLKDVLYDADDVVDDFASEALRLEVDNHCPGLILNKVINFVPRLVFNFEMGHKVKDIRERLDQISADKRDFHFTKRVVDRQVTIRGRETHSFMHESEIIGRNSEKEEMLELLGGANDCELSVLAIEGIGGLGKTALAKLVYNDMRVTGQFKPLMWVHVSDNFNLRIIIEKVIECPNSGLSLEDLQKRLQEKLDGNKFLLILDDLWVEDPMEWAGLRELLTVGANGSKVLITTRNQNVGKMVGRTYNLRGLSDDECWALFAKWAFDSGDDKRFPALIKIGKEIVKKCSGVPLAAKTLGGMLYSKTEEHDWLYVQDSEIWKLEQSKFGIMPVLRLSFDQLSSHIKQCFAYCSTYWRGHEFNKEMLIQLWIAQDFIQPDDNHSVEFVASQCFNALRSRSFFQDIEEDDYNQRTKCKMHNLVHDLACLVSAPECTSVNFDTENFAENVRHVLLFDPLHQRREFPKSLLKLKKLRTLIWPCGMGVDRSVEPFDIDPLFLSFRYLRVLDLFFLQIHELPSSIGNLKHLRYLDLSWNQCMRRLPNSICKLYNLQTLRLNDCENLQELPRDIWKLRRLRHFYLSSLQRTLPEMGMGGLNSLQTLFIDKCNLLTLLPISMQQFRSLENLRIMYCSELCFSDNDLQGLRNLQRLTLVSLPKMVSLPSGLSEANATLRSLYISGCSGLEKLPEWLGSFASLQRLTIENCPSLKSFPDGMSPLTGLRVLRINGCVELSRRCERGKGEDWLKIAHIPEIYLEGIKIKLSDD